MLLISLALCLNGCLYVELNGPVTGAQITITEWANPEVVLYQGSTRTAAEVRARAGEQKWAQLNDYQKLLRMGYASFDRSLVDSSLKEGSLYLITVTGGYDQDADRDGLLDANPTRIAGSWHSIVNGAQLKSGYGQVSLLTEAAYQLLKNERELYNLLNIRTVQAVLAQRLVGDLDNSGAHATHWDLPLWSHFFHPDAFRGDASAFAPLSRLIVENSPESRDPISQQLLDIGAGIERLENPGLRRCVLPQWAAVAELTALDCSDGELESLDGIELFTQLVSLNLSNNDAVEDLSPLAALVNLESLDLSYSTEMDDLAPLASLNKLEHLDLQGMSGIEDWSAVGRIPSLTSLSVRFADLLDLNSLAPLQQLETLDMAGSSTTDLTPLTNLSALRTLDLSLLERGGRYVDQSELALLPQLTSLKLEHNTLEDASFLGELTALEELSLSHTRPGDYSFLAELTALTRLDLEENQLTRIDFLASLTGLTWLGLHDNQIEDLSPLVGMSSLQHLDLNDNYSSPDPAPLARLTALESLVLFGTGTTDLEFLTELDGLRRLSLSWNGIEDISELPAFTDLEELYLRGNRIADIGVLANLTRLHTLHLQDNDITDLTPLAQLRALEELTLSGNNIADIASLTALAELNTLTLGENSISDISPLRGLLKLEALGLDDNEISDIAPLFGLTSLQSLDISSNVGIGCEQILTLWRKLSLQEYDGRYCEPGAE